MAAHIGTREEAHAWLERYHESSAKLDAASWLEDFSTDDVVLQYANFPELQGESVRQMFADTFSKLDMMTHHVKEFDVVGSRIYQSCTIRYLVKGDDPDKDVIEIRGCAVFDRRQVADGRVKCSRAEVYLDPSALFSRIQEKFGVA